MSSLRMAAKTNRTAAARTLARELVRERKERDRLVTSRTRLDSVSRTLAQQQGERAGVVES